jgi:hypothetical protein
VSSLCVPGKTVFPRVEPIAHVAGKTAIQHSFCARLCFNGHIPRGTSRRNDSSGGTAKLLMTC